LVLKRSFDILVSLIILIIFSPVILLIVFLIAVLLGAPVFFIQIRPGLKSKPFNLYKFRTMTNEIDSDGNLLSNKNRMTKLGNILRSFSLDELPEFFNVLKGEMSLVGPRPLLMEYLSQYNATQIKRHDIKPGITGWAQINGRNAITWEEKFKLDIWYVNNQSFWLDIKILFLTVSKVLSREGISHKGNVAMPRFTGNKEG
jgi:lipopolysaccharide/colanic/teichoic acid biosynthesis glycosyltransferase